MKLKLPQLLNLLMWLFSVIRRIFLAESANISADMKHAYVKDYIMPIIKKKRLGFNGADVDSIINGLIWFLNKLTKRRGESYGD